ncbi:MAG TPA: tRNA (N(6)-L-threonylcarbamoyladenosine(37)-C(2))-methylthiotransferase MtaB [Candidatus Cybelea sp.]|nr:tRNA (N(6)-L-threonylcarbamoyladenosine(37)-C(2))-methylthiotransferase MtaB [Candidatus Cybelea sp.]
MITFSVQNFGCRATEADAASLRNQFLSTGWTTVDDQACADVVVLNTCTVTAAADAQAREAIRKVHEANPRARIVITGCYAQRAPEEIAELPGVTIVAGNSRWSEIPAAIVAPGGLDPGAGPEGGFVPLSRLHRPISPGPGKIMTGDIFRESALLPNPAPVLTFDRTRPILKIQDGCNHRCSYCVIPFVRGRSRSLPPTRAVEEVRAMVSRGVKEIVLSGINLGSYGRDLSPQTDLPALVKRILAGTDLERLRFSSIEPQDITEDFLDLVASSERIAPHLHVPMQSGSDRILKAMHRWYRADHYARRIHLIRLALPHAAIGADVMAGFPGETEQDFAATVDLIRVLPFTYLHAFSFSARPGTRAAKLSFATRPGEIRRRARALRSLGEEKARRFRASESLQVERGLTLSRQGDDWTECLTGNYLRVRIPGRYPANHWVDVRVTASVSEIGSLAGPAGSGPSSPADDPLAAVSPGD